jgi:hypothetical protein
MTLKESGVSKGHGWDDEIHFNTQFSSQWDSLVHWSHQPTGLSYNGIEVTKEMLAANHTAANAAPTLDHWHARGGLVARGVLIDFKEWAEKKARDEGKTGGDAIVHALDGHRITVEEIEAVAKDQGVEFRPGDVLIVRTGLTEHLQAPTPEDYAKLQNTKISGGKLTTSLLAPRRSPVLEPNGRARLRHGRNSNKGSSQFTARWKLQSGYGTSILPLWLGMRGHSKPCHR